MTEDQFAELLKQVTNIQIALRNIDISLSRNASALSDNPIVRLHATKVGQSKIPYKD